MTKTTGSQDADFVKHFVKNGINDASWVLEWVASKFWPEDVFTPDDLKQWALRNGFVEEE